MATIRNYLSEELETLVSKKVSSLVNAFAHVITQGLETRYRVTPLYPGEMDATDAKFIYVNPDDMVWDLGSEDVPDTPENRDCLIGEIMIPGIGKLPVYSY